MSDVLDTFLPAVARWFRKRYGPPTPPQELGWPAIQRGEHTLILSPTGSGKTMAAFLWGINAIFSALALDPELKGVQLLYISPLRALNNDIERNLREPLAGIRKMAHEMGQDLPALRVAVRTGDTPQSVRQQLVKKPPHILITTPESLYLMLTSPKASETLTTTKTVIVDEIHTLCGNKRGVHLAITLERLGLRTGKTPQRIGLSATQRPLDEVARYLVGQEWAAGGGEEQLVSREVTIIDAGAHKELDLKVVTVVPDLRRLPGGSIWPALIPQVLDEVRRHRTTLIFTNSRRSAERAADRLNEQYAMEEAEEVAPGSPEGLLNDGVPKAQGMFGTGATGGPFHAHHGSIAKEARLKLEQQLKAGELPALVGTSSLELGIDIGSVDEVVQLQSPRSVARGLQRVGRAGHLVGQTSVGRIYATFREDLLDAGAVAHGMITGDIEPTYTPQNCLDVLAQQLVALVATGDQSAEAAYRLMRQAYGYQNLTRDAFRAVLGMLSGQYPSEAFHELRPRIVWDRVHDQLAALGGSRLLAINNGGTIPDVGQFKVYLPDRKTLLGTLDEEFVYETHEGDVFTLGGNTWRALQIDGDKIIVGDAASSMPRMPFWKGDAPRREYFMGERLGAFRRKLAERVKELPELPDDPGLSWPREAYDVIGWLAEEYRLDEPSAKNAMLYVRQQLEVMGAISSDRTVIVEVFADAVGDQRMAIHSCFGGRVNSAWALALAHALRDRYGFNLEVQANDDGILFRFLQADREPPIDIVRTLGPDEARERLLQELPSSAMFGAQFRMNAARALLLPGVQGAHKRTPFWLQRMRAKDLLAVAKGFPDFPIIAETYRDCLSDLLDLAHLMELLGAIQKGEVRVVEAETLVPSPVAGSLLFDFIAIQMYEHDLPKAERQIQALAVNRELLGQLLEEGLLPDLLRPRALADIEEDLQHLAPGRRARTADELGQALHELGDLTADEAQARSLGEGRAWLMRLALSGRAFEVEIPGKAGAVKRWIAAEDYRRYRDAFGLPAEPPASLPEELLVPHLAPEAAREALLRVLTRSHGPLTRDQITARYAFPEAWLDVTLERMVETGLLVTGRLSPGATAIEWCDRRVLERIHRHTLGLLRSEIKPVSLPAYADFLARWQGAHPSQRRRGEEGLVAVLKQLRGLAVPAIVWERDLLALRLADYRAARLDELCAEGDLVWVARGEGARAGLRFLFRGEGALFLDPEPEGESLSEVARKVWQFLKEEGACYTADIQRGTALSGAELDGALMALLLAGVATNDHFEAMRRVMSGEVAQGEGERRPQSALEAELSAWRAARHAPAPGRRPEAQRLRQARRDVQERLAPPTRWNGRWSLVHRQGVWGGEVAPEERTVYQARQLLQRYGIVSRECLENEEGHAEWALLYRQLELMEMRGEVRRGYFVRGLSGAQFGTPEAVERLREWNQPDASDAAELVVLNACDPANLYGPALSAVRAADMGDDQIPDVPGGDSVYHFARLSANYVVLQRGVPVLLYEHGGSRWTTLPQAEESILRKAVRALLLHLTRDGGLCARPRRVVVASWNGRVPIGSSAQPLLEELGFHREPLSMIWDGA